MRYKILLCDDEHRNFEEWTLQAEQCDVELVCYEDWEGAQSELEEKWDSYDAIILDAKGKLNPDSKSEDIRHLSASHLWLSEQRVHGRYKPVVLYSGYPEDAYNQIVDPKEILLKRFQKQKTGLSEVLNTLGGIIDRQPERIIEFKYPDVFPFINNYFSPENIAYFVKLTHKDAFNSNDDVPSKIDHLRNLRRLNEQLWDIIAVENFGFNLAEYEDNKGGRTKKIIQAVNGGELRRIPQPIFNWGNHLYLVASKYGDHNPIEDPNLENLPSRYTIAQFVYGFMDSILWAKQLLHEED